MELLVLIEQYGGIDFIFRSILLFSGAFFVTFIIVKITSLLFKVLIPSIFIIFLIVIAVIFGDFNMGTLKMGDLYYNLELFVWYIYKFYIDILNASGIMALVGIVIGALTAIFYPLRRKAPYFS